MQNWVFDARKLFDADGKPKNITDLDSDTAEAKKNGTSNHTVKRIVLEVPEISHIVQHKKNENTADILVYI